MAFPDSLLCQYPGCVRPPRPSAPGGRAPRYCEQRDGTGPIHNRQNARARRAKASLAPTSEPNRDLGLESKELSAEVLDTQGAGTCPATTDHLLTRMTTLVSADAANSSPHDTVRLAEEAIGRERQRTDQAEAEADKLRAALEAVSISNRHLLEASRSELREARTSHDKILAQERAHMASLRGELAATMREVRHGQVRERRLQAQLDTAHEDITVLRERLAAAEEAVRALTARALSAEALNRASIHRFT